MKYILFLQILFTVHIQTKSEGTDGKKPGNEVVEIFCVDNVQLYFISADKNIKPTTESTKRLKLWRLKDGKLLLHMEKSLSYPLVPNVTPVVHSKDGAIILPDLEKKGAAVGLKLPDGLDKVLLQAINEEVEKKYNERATTILTGADTIANGLVSKAEELKVFIDKETAQYRTGPPVQAGSYKGLSSSTKQVKTVSTSVLAATSWAANIMDNVYKRVGEVAAPHFQAGTSRVISTVMGAHGKDDKEPDELTIASIKAYNKISTAFSKSTTILTDSVKQNSVQIFQHNYGEDMGGAMDDALDAAKNTVTVIGHIRSFTPIGIIRNTAGHIVDYDPNGNGHSEHVCHDS